MLAPRPRRVYVSRTWGRLSRRGRGAEHATTSSSNPPDVDSASPQAWNSRTNSRARRRSPGKSQEEPRRAPDGSRVRPSDSRNHSGPGLHGRASSAPTEQGGGARAELQGRSGVERLALPADDSRGFLAGCARREELHSGGRIGDDHRRSRRSRIKSAGLVRADTGSRDLRRCISSSVVGRSSPLCSSASAYADKDMPARAALALSLRCTSSGTFRT